ncbi:hypothetical protein NHX12_031135, partial [Muraenolepis orangiensis]
EQSSASLSPAHSSSFSAIFVVLIFCGLGAGGVGYFLWRRQKIPFDFHYFKNENEAEPVPASLVSIDNPLYSENTNENEAEPVPASLVSIDNPLYSENT